MLQEELIECTQCKKEKNGIYFNKRKNGKHYSYCSDCTYEYNKKRYRSK